MIRFFVLSLLFAGTCLLLGGCTSDQANANGQPPTNEQMSGYQVMTAGPLSLAVDPQMGARIASFTYEGKEILKTSRDENNWQWGSTVWTSPQSDWNWPPGSLTFPRSVDSAPCKATSKLAPALKNAGSALENS